RNASGEVERHAADEFPIRGARRRSDAVSLEIGIDVGIDRSGDVLLVESVSAAAAWNITQHRGHAFSRAAEFVRVGRYTGFAKRIGHEACALRSEVRAVGMSVGIGIRR